MTLSVAGILGLGLVIGMQHALEADHVAAVSSIAVRQRNVRRIIAHGAIWGAGHTITLMLFWPGRRSARPWPDGWNSPSD